MPTAQSVHEILDLIHIDKIGVIEGTIDIIRELYEAPAIVRDFEEFKEVCLDYMQHHSSLWYGLEMPENMAWGRIRGILDDLPRPQARLSRVRGYLEGQGGYIRAVKNSTTGRQGGMIRTLDLLRDSLKDEAVRQWIENVFLTCISPLDWQQRADFAEEYLLHYGQYLLPEEQTISAGELAGQLETLLEMHMRAINQLRNILQ